jgi:hypothetical protein
MSVFLDLDDPTGTAFSSDQLPQGPVDPSLFQSSWLFAGSLSAPVERMEIDLCPYHSTHDNDDVDENGIGDCECGDQNGDGTVDVRDLVAINRAIFNPALATPLCDTNNDDVCDVRDLIGANMKIFGRPAYCSRYPHPL